MCGKGWLRDQFHSFWLTKDFDHSWVNNDDVPDVMSNTRFNERSKYADVPSKQHKFSVVEDFSSETWDNAYHQMSGASDDIAPGFTTKWTEIANNINNAASNFEGYVNGLGPGQNPKWQGQSAQAVADNAKRSLEVVKRAHHSANIMSILVDGFSRAVHGTKQEFVQNQSHFLHDTDASKVGQAAAEDAKHDYNSYAQQVLQVRIYRPGLTAVEDNHPDLSGVTLPSVSDGPPAVPAGPTGGGGGGAGGGPVTPGGMGTPDVPQLDLPVGPNAGPSGPPSGGSGNPAQAAGQAAQQAGQAAQQAGQQAQNAAGQGANAAKQALDQMLNGGKGPGGLPEGVLGLGPKGLSGAAKAGGGSGAHGGGNAARTPTAKPAAQMAPPTKAAAAVPASRAGASSAGGPGAGAPAAGHRGGAAGTVHKASKALRNQKNGEEVAGETEAVVPVVGGGSAESATAKPHST